MIQNKELHDRIMAFDIDGGPSDFTFAMKLAKQQKWTREYTERVIQEYRRFLYLGAVEGHVSPSPPVDEAWHLHLTYTVSYWERLCGEVLGKPFHHNPSRGRKESAKYSQLSETTLEMYERVFGEIAPADIWKSSPSKPEFWMIPKVKTKRVVAYAALSGAFALIAAGCASSSSETSLLPFFVVGLLFFAIVVVIIVAIAQSGKRDRLGQGNGTGSGSGNSFLGCGTSHTNSSTHASDGDTTAHSHGHSGDNAGGDASTDGGGQSSVSDSGGHNSGSDGGSSGGDGSSGCGGGGGGD